MGRARAHARRSVRSLLLSCHHGLGLSCWGSPRPDPGVGVNLEELVGGCKGARVVDGETWGEMGCLGGNWGELLAAGQGELCVQAKPHSFIHSFIHSSWLHW